MKSKTIHILIIEDNQTDFVQFNTALDKSILDCKVIWKQTLADGIQEINKGHTDTILLDLSLTDSSGIETLSRIIELEANCAIIVLTDDINEQLGVEAMKIGAQDYLIKTNLDPASLPRIIRYAYERKETEKLLQNHQLILEKEVEKQTRELLDSNRKLREEIETRNKIEKSLAESEENFRLISISAKDAIVKMDCNGKVAFWNPAAESIFGYSAEEIIGKDAHELLAPPDQKEEARHGVEKFLKNGQGKLLGNTIEMDFRRKDGTILPMEISLSSLKTSTGKYQAVGIIRDISERRKTENQIRETNLFLQTLINTIPVPIFYKNIQGIYLGGNHAFFSFLGKKPEDVIGKPVHRVVAEKKFAGTFVDMDKKLFKSGTKQVYEAKAMNSHGEVRDVIFHKAAYKNSDGETAGLVGIFIDVTETRVVTRELTELKEHLEEKVSERTEQLEQANATKDKFFSIIAHDLKSPFNIIQGFLTLINDEFDEFNSQELKEFIGKTLEASTNTFSLLENLLEWSRSQRGTIEYKPVRMNLCDACNEVIYQINETAKNKKIRIINNIDHYHDAFADANMTRTIFRNLITNALKFSHPLNNIQINSEISGNMLVVCVQDNGIGMTKDYLEKLFIINEKTQREGTCKEKGTGLGLILCKEFVEKNNGELWVKSRENEGSSFYFSLPVATDKHDGRYAV